METLRLIWKEGHGNHFVVEAVRYGRVVGMAAGRRYGGDSCEILSVEVVQAFRRRGIGQSLVRAVQARNRHITACTVSEAGARLLRRCGFQPFVEPNAGWSWSGEPALVGDRDF